MLLSFIKLLGGVVVKNWRLLLPVVLVGGLYFYVQDIKHERDDALADVQLYKNELDETIEAWQVESARIEVENAQKEKAFKQLNARAKAVHREQLATLKINNQKDREKIKQQLEAYRAENLLNRNKLAAAKQRLQLYSAVENRTGANAASEIASQASNSEAQSECHRVGAYTTTLERGCAITTSDFNACSQWVEDVCAVYGCSE